MKRVHFILAALFTVLTIHTNAETITLPDDSKLHSFLAPPYNDGRFNNDPEGFKKQLTAAYNQQKSYFQDPSFRSRIESHLIVLLGNKFPAGGVQEVIDSTVFLPAPPDLAARAYIASLPADRNGQVIWGKRGPYVGEMVGFYKGIMMPWISAACGNFLKPDFSFKPTPPPPSSTTIVERRDTTIVREMPNGNLSITINNTNSNTNNNTNSNTATTPAGGMGASNVTFASGPSNNSGGQYNGYSNNQPAKQQVEYSYKPNGLDYWNGITTGLSRLGNTVANLKTAFNPEPWDIRIQNQPNYYWNNNWGSGWDTGWWGTTGGGFNGGSGVYYNNQTNWGGNPGNWGGGTGNGWGSGWGTTSGVYTW